MLNPEFSQVWSATERKNTAETQPAISITQEYNKRPVNTIKKWP